MENSVHTKVCVTGANGYISSGLVKKLLVKGYTVHATLRNLEDKSKVGPLQSLPNAEKQLFLFQADMYNPSEFEAAIEGCEYLFLVATPMYNDTTSSKYKDRIEATVASVRSIIEICIRIRTVKRLIYTGSVMAASPLNDNKNGNGFESFDESCWTPLENLSLTYITDYTLEYIKAKTIAEQAILNYNDTKGSDLEVVSLPCGLVGGDTSLSHVPLSVETMLSQVSGNVFGYKHGLCLLQELLGSVPLVHVDDVCEAHIFCIEKASMKGRFLCVAATATVKEIADHFKENHPDFKIDEKFIENQGNGSTCSSSKLTNLGFEYKYKLKEILDESLGCANRRGYLSVGSVGASEKD